MPLFGEVNGRFKRCSRTSFLILDIINLNDVRRNRSPPKNMRNCTMSFAQSGFQWQQCTRLNMFMLVVLMAPVVAGLSNGVADEWFKKLDLNGDGNIDKAEYEDGIAKISAYLANAATDGLANPGGNSARDLYFPFEFTFDGFWKAFTSSVAMIMATEIGDKTFFIAAVLSMKHDRSAVFAGAITALIVMTVLSTGMGLVLPRILPKQYTHILGGILFLYFGVRLYSESLSMEDGKASDELEEVEEELLRSSKKRADEEEGGIANRAKTQQQAQYKFWYQVAVQALTLTFLAEWGDRSQIATIALAAAKNPLGVTIGGCLGHATCTGLAVIGGRMLAAKISEKTVSKWGGITFFFFGLHSIFLES